MIFVNICEKRVQVLISEIYDLLAPRAVRIPDGFLSRHVRSSFPEQGVTMPQFDTLCRGALLYPQTIRNPGDRALHSLPDFGSQSCFTPLV